MGIPKIVHQIWIGPKKRPDIWMDTVKSFCETQGFEYVLWDDKMVGELKMVNQSFYDKESTYNGKSDILRYEILYQYGGVYIDADSVILKPEQFNTLLTEFNKDAGFGFEINGKLVCGGVSIAIKESRLIKHCIDAIPGRDMTKLAWISVGPQLITDMVSKYQKEIPLMLYPSTVFYPVRWHGIQDVDLHTKTIVPPESVMFQYGYSTNNLESKI
jgi:mannosyltransferase OCH1-like enzyme